MGRKTSIDRLPREIRDLIARLREQGREIDEIRDKLAELDVEVPRSTLGRHIQRIDAVYERVRESRAAADAIVARLPELGDSRTARLNIELMHASVMELLSGGDGKSVTLDPQSAMFLGRTLRDLATAAKQEAEREMKIRKETAEKAAATVEDLAAKAGISKTTRDQWRRQVLGIADDTQ